jgi:hypothetical protein
MFWSQLLLWLSGLPVIFFGILGTMFGVILVSGTEIDDAAGVLFIVLCTMLTLIGSGLWFYASWRFYRGNKE